MKNLHNVISNTKHTEGPWLAKWSTHGGGDNSPKKGWFVTDQREVLMLIDIPDSGTSEADAKLIAASPELFNALDDVLSKTYSTNDGNYRCDMTGELFELIKSAIKKAAS